MSTATKQPTRFALTPGTGNYLCDIDYPITRSDPAAGGPNPMTEMTAPTVLLPISPLAAFDRLRKTVRDDLRQLGDELSDYLEVLGIAAATERPAVDEQPVAHKQPLPQKRRRWHR